MKERLTVSTLTKDCSLYIHLEELYPLSCTSLEAALGIWVHDVLAEAVKLFVKGEEIPVEELLTTVAENHSNRLIKTMKDDKPLRREAARLVNNGIMYLHSLYIKGKDILVEEKVETVIQEIPVKLVGRIDLAYSNTIVDWKTGTFIADEHRTELQLYAYLLSKAGIMSPPIVIRIVYLGGNRLDTVIEIITEDDIKRIHDRIIQLIQSSNTNPMPNPSTACFFCGYKYKCPQYARLFQEERIMARYQKAVLQAHSVKQHKKIGNEFKKLSKRIKIAANKIINRPKPIDKDALFRQCPELITEKVWLKQFIPLLDNLSEKEKEELLLSILQDNNIIDKDKLPHNLRNMVYAFKMLDVNKQ